MYSIYFIIFEPKKENCMSQNTVTLCWYPPAKTYLPSPAMTVLKKSLQEVGIDVQIVYWNILLEDILLRYFFNEKKSLDDDIASLGIFFAYIAIERKYRSFDKAGTLFESS